MTSSLQYIRRLIANTGYLDLDQDSVGTESLALLSALFKQDGFRVSQVADVQESANQLTFTGTFPSLYHWKDITAQCCLIDASTSSPGLIERHILFQFDLPPELDADTLLTIYSSGMDPADLAEEFPETILDHYLESIAFTKQIAIFSSIGYNEDLDSHYPDSFKETLTASQIKAGLNFPTEIRILEDIMTFLKEMFDGEGNEQAIFGQAHISQGETDPYFTIGWAFNSSKEITPFTLKLNEISLGHNLIEGETEIWPQLLVNGSISKGNSTGSEFTIGAEFDFLNQELTLAFNDFPTLREWIELAELNDLETDYFPDSSILDVRLSRLEIGIDLTTNQTTKPTILFMGLDLTMEKEIDLLGAIEPFKDRVKLKPKLTLDIYSPLDPVNRTIEGELSGAWELGTTHFDTRLTYPDLTMYAALAEGETLEISEVAGSFLSEIDAESLPSITLTDMEIQGNPAEKSLEIRLAADSDWKPVDDVDFAINHLEMAMSHIEQESFFHLSGQLTVAGIGVYISADYSAGWQFQGSTAPNQEIPIGNLITDLAQRGFGTVTLPEPVKTLTLQNVMLAFNTATKNFSFGCQAEFTIDNQPLNMILVIDITRQINQPRNNISYSKLFGGHIMIGGLQFNLEFKSDLTSSSFTAAFLNTANEPIDLAGLISAVSPNEDIDLALPNTGTFSENNLPSITISELGLTVKTGSEKGYSFRATAEWDTKIHLFDNEDSLIVQAEVELEKENDTLSGMISGSLQTPLPLLENLKIKVIHNFTKKTTQTSSQPVSLPQSSSSETTQASHQETGLIFRLELGKLMLNATYHSSTDSSKTILTFDTAGSKISLGEMLTSLAALANPSIDEFQLDSPWDILNNIQLENFKLTITLPKNKALGPEVQMIYDADPKIDLGDGLFSINKIILKYKKAEANLQGNPDRGLIVEIEGSVLGQSIPKWDALNEFPPDPGQNAAMFELRYLGLGQHVTFEKINELNNITSVMQALKGGAPPLLPAHKNQNPLTALAAYPGSLTASAGKLIYSPESEWLIGLDVSLLKTINLMVIFNDPFIYGLRIELYGDMAKNFAGLQFEILYQRISDTLGKYHTELTLPDKFRYMQVGAVSITLPVIVVDIFTNGDFKVDLGFPWNFNFSRSFAIEIFPFVGAGGFYFNKLSAATTTLVPTAIPGHPLKPPEEGVFTPVYEFGLGFEIGYGKSFQSGPLNAEIQITVQGIITGVISWYNPIKPAGDKELYYKISGGVAVVGRLYGEVDFGIISVTVEVIARAMIVFIVEVYQPIHILLAADVSVKASVKVAFITISFSFNLRVEQEFTIPSPQGNTLPPWVQ